MSKTPNIGQEQQGRNRNKKATLLPTQPVSSHCSYVAEFVSVYILVNLNKSGQDYPWSHC